VSVPRLGEDTDPLSRPFFVKGELSSFSVRPTTRRNFLGIAAGVSALPRDANNLLNAYYLTIEPQLDISNPDYHWKLGLGAPLQYELMDTRGAFEVCVGQAKQVRAGGAGQNEVAAATAGCVLRQKGRLTQNFGKLRAADWDEASDYAKLVRYVAIGGQEQPFYMSLSRLYDQSFGHGTVVRHYNPNIDYNTARLGANIDFNRAAVGVQGMANDLVRPDVLGIMGFVRPFRPFSQDTLARSLSVGVSLVHGVDQPKTLKYERGLFGASFDQPLPEVDQELHLMGSRFHQASVVGVDVEAKLLRTSWADLKVYADYSQMLDYGGGATLGSLWRFSFGQPAHQALRARAEMTVFAPDYLPNYFDAFHDIFQFQYLPGGYEASNGHYYYPTKLEYLEASRGGRRRVGGYLELTYAVLDYLALGFEARAWTPFGSPREEGFVGPSFPDYGSPCAAGEGGVLECQQTVDFFREPSFSSLRVHAELPFRRFLQAFASYEVFSATAENGLGVFRFDGDNEVFFSGARVALLPILFISAEARRYFFVQRLTNVDTTALTFEQDQTFHSRWTFAINASLGYEF
jgi:hypothetical protein